VHENVERNTLDLRYQGYRLRDRGREARLLADIVSRGIEEPLQGVDTGNARVLLNGFKRFRCAQKLHLECVPYISLGQEEADGILQLMQGRQEQGLNILEQAKFVGELLTVHGMSPVDVAESLGRSKGWVSMRRGLLDEMSSTIQQVLFAGKFPVYCYMYTLRRFMRMNEVRQQDIEAFVRAVAGRRLSVREIDLLAEAFFRGSDSLRQGIEAGKLDWTLEYLQNVPDDQQGCNAMERMLLKDLQAVQKLMQQFMAKCGHRKLASRAFFAQANLLASSVLTQLGPFEESMRKFHDRSGHL
jgi:hypothetical protein